MSKQSGYWVKITCGNYEGKHGIVYHSEQTRDLLAMNRCLVHVYEGGAAMVPVLDGEGKPVKTLKNTAYLKTIGYVD